MKNFLLYFLLFFSCYVQSFAGDFKIVEVMPNTINDKNLEYFTIKNTSYGVKSLSGFILSDRSEKIYTFLDEILHP
jgi:hypothetical protein